MRFTTTIICLLTSLLVEAQKTKILGLDGKWRFTIGDREEYAQPDCNDSNWEKIKVGTPWENEGFENYNGYAWYRYEFDGSQLGEFENLILSLGYIDDVHEAYLNGKLIGFKGSFPPDYYTAYDAFNEYALPESAINRNGKNVIGVKVYDLHQDGGIVKGKPAIYFEADVFEGFYNLEGVWKFSTNRDRFWEEWDYDDSDWENIVVPSYWRSKHIKRSKGYGWYRKDFRVPQDLRNKDLYLILGKIDDFDYTYINGKLIGRTKDFLPFGESESYNQLRVYKIPKELLKPTGRNVVAVSVEDIGIDAGIYDGPVGLAEKIGSKSSRKR